jgi:dTDP-glucose 4,6-dehydratase
MKILVTGACGFIGSHFVEAAERAGHEVFSVDALTYAGRSANLGGREFWRADICDGVHMHALVERFRPDAIVHLAAESHVARSIDSPDEFLRTNVMGTHALLEVALAYWRAHPAFRFLHVSTDEVYGSLSESDPPWTEASPYSPRNPYAASKAASDHLALSYHETFGLPVIVTHCANNYGPRQHPEKLIPTLLRQLLFCQAMTLHGDGQNIRDWIHVEDHCAGLLAALERGTPGETYNFGGECERTNAEIAHLCGRTINAVLGRPSSYPYMAVHTDDRPGNDRRYSTDVMKVWIAFGWQPGPAIEDRIVDVARWYAQNTDYDLGYGR